MVVTVLMAASAIILSGGVARAASKPTLSIDPIQGDFVQRYFDTTYYTHNVETVRNEPVSVKWSIKLELVDKAGAPDPSSPGSGAAVDLGCTNAGLGVGAPVVTKPYVSEVGKRNLTQIIWRHPDAADSNPPGRYHCNHLEEGPHGHQGLITVVVSDKNWECTATYKGTNSSVYASPIKVNPNVRNGTASEPKCSRIR